MKEPAKQLKIVNSSGDSIYVTLDLGVVNVATGGQPFRVRNKEDLKKLYVIVETMSGHLPNKLSLRPGQYDFVVDNLKFKIEKRLSWQWYRDWPLTIWEVTTIEADKHALAMCMYLTSNHKFKSKREVIDFINTGQFADKLNEIKRCR